jgi:hypothetical protein
MNYSSPHIISAFDPVVERFSKITEQVTRLLESPKKGPIGNKEVMQYLNRRTVR